MIGFAANAAKYLPNGRCIIGSRCIINDRCIIGGRCIISHIDILHIIR